MGVTRRRILGAGAVVVGAAALSRLACGPRRSVLAWRPERLWVAGLDIPEPARIGACLRGQVPPDALASAIGNKPGLAAAMTLECPGQRATVILAQIQRDYSQGDVVLVERWVVARSEALIAAVQLG